MLPKPAVGNSPPFVTNLPFHDFAQNCEPLIVVEIFGKIVKRPGVCHSSPFVGQSPFRTFLQTFQPALMVSDFVETFEMEIVQQKGVSGTRLEKAGLSKTG